MLFADTPGPAAIAAVRNLDHQPFWLDDPTRPTPQPPVGADAACDLLVIGGGFTGLWTALLAKEQDPNRSVMLVDGGRIADAASGRNGGFMSHSLTHGFGNGLARWPNEMPTLLRLGYQNLDQIERTITEYGIDCDFHRPGELSVAVQAHQGDGLRALIREMAPYDAPMAWLDAEQAQARVASSAYLGALWDPRGAMVNPARLAWGLLRACLEAGVVVHEGSLVTGLGDDAGHVSARVDEVVVTARRVAVATNAFPPLLRSIRRRVVPVYDYVLVTEPLSDAQWTAIGWQGREGISDAGNQFHYYRRTADGRILWGGYDAIYHRGNGFGPAYEVDAHAFARLAEHFFQTFPQLAGLGFTHGWGGAIDTCSRFAPFWGTAHGGKTAYAVGYTGLGVGSSRFGAQVMLDLLAGRVTERTELAMVRTKPMPFPPEPLRSIGIGWTVASLRAADRSGGRRNAWLRTLDRLGLGFDS